MRTNTLRLEVSKVNRIGTNRIVPGVIALGLLLAPAGRGEQQALSIGQLAAELKAVKAELLAVRLELETGRVARLELEHTTAAANYRRLERRERTADGAVAHIDRQLNSPDVDAEQRTELELNRSEVLDFIARARERRAEAEHKESEIARQLRLARQTLTNLLERSKQQNTE
jgi:hypothetical protein